MRIPTSGSYGRLRTVIRHRSSTYSVTRPTVDTSARFGESTDASTATVSVDAWLHQPSEVNVDGDFGDRLAGDLQGLSLPVEDIEVGDRFDHGLATYEVETVRHLPDEDDQKLKLFSLARRTND